MTKPTSIALFPVESDRIAVAGYDAATQTLGIGFKGDSRVYHYKGVPHEVYEGFTKAESKGRYLYANIYHKFPFDRLEADGTVSKSWNPDPPQPLAA